MKKESVNLEQIIEEGISGLKDSAENTSKQYVFKSMEDAVDAIKAEITSVIKAGDLYTWRRDQHGRAEKTAEELVNRINGKDMFLMSHVHLRILFLYFPDIFFGITAMKPLRNCMTILGFQKNEIPKSAIRMQIMLIAEKNTHPIMKKWNNYDYSHFLYQIHIYSLLKNENAKVSNFSLSCSSISFFN